MTSYTNKSVSLYLEKQQFSVRIKSVEGLEPPVLGQRVCDLHDVVLGHGARGARAELVEEVRLHKQQLLEVLLTPGDDVLLVVVVYLLPLELGQRLPAGPAHEEHPHLVQLLAGCHVASLLQQLLELLPQPGNNTVQFVGKHHYSHRRRAYSTFNIHQNKI